MAMTECARCEGEGKMDCISCLGSGVLMPCVYCRGSGKQKVKVGGSSYQGDGSQYK